MTDVRDNPDERDDERPAPEPVAEEVPVFSTGLTARVADSYGADPHEHKPSQDPFDASQPEKQAETGGAYVDEEDRWAGTSFSTSNDETPSTDETTDGDSTPAPTMENPSPKDQTDSSSASGTATVPSRARSTKAAK